MRPSLPVSYCSLPAAVKRQRSESAPPAPGAITESEAANEPPLRARVHPELPEYSFTVIGEKSADGSATLRVKTIEIRRGAANEPIQTPIQTIDGLDTATPLTAGVAPLETVDMNFDGYQDIRLIESQPAGPNTPYLNWLFDPTSGRFVESRALNEIPAPEFDAAKRQIRSSWRAGATRYGTDVYVYDQGKPVAVRKETKEYKGPGVYTLRVWELKDGDLKVTQQREVREP